MAVIIARGLINVVIETDAFRKLTDLSVEGIRVVNEDSIIRYINTCVTPNKCNNLMLFFALLGLVRHLSFSLYCLLFILLVILSL